MKLNSKLKLGWSILKFNLASPTKDLLIGYVGSNPGTFSETKMLVLDYIYEFEVTN